jgi:RNA polymerase sigma-54 factor
MQTPRGVYPLRMFFSGGTESADGEEISWQAVQAKLKEVIENENKAKPWSDEQLVEELKKHGIEIARRTVAKYRGQMNIPPARQRKEY